ncbi:ABC transporter substrate-binding protein [bacterium]|nr:ABC transporter substrate-binding protein [bacterium]
MFTIRTVSASFPLLLIGLLGFVLHMIIPPINVCAQEKQIAVVMYKKSSVYDATLVGLRSHLASTNTAIRISDFDLADAGSFEQLEKLAVDVIVSFGTTATGQLIDRIKDIPIIFTAVLGPVQFKLGQANVTGSFLNVPVQSQFVEFMKLSKSIHRIGVLYNPELNRDKVESARTAVHELGLELIGLEIGEYNEIIPKLDAWLKGIDALWIIADNVVCKPVNIQHLMLQAMKYKVPVLAFSPAIVKAGAVLALSADYRDIGKQTAELLLQVLNGVAPDSIEPTMSRTYELYLNKGIAQKLGLGLPADMLQSAREIYGQ